MRMLRSRIATPLAALALVSAMGPAAVADTWTHHDPLGDGRNGWENDTDVRRVQVDAGRKWVVVRVRTNGTQEYSTRLYLDVDRSQPGPELVAERYTDSARRRVFVTINRSYRIRCKPKTSLVSPDGRVMRWRIPTVCLRWNGRLPTQLRVRLETDDDYQTIDQVPDKGRFGRWFDVG